MRALITGASSGIGRDIAICLAKKKYDVILVARRYDRLLELKNEIESKYKVNAFICVKDLSKQDECFSLFNEVKNIDVLVNNAGLGNFGKFTSTDIKDDINLINVNVLSLHILTKLYINEINDGGHILNVASIAGFMAGPLLSSYYASKAYVLRLSEAINEELRSENKNIFISVLCPGPVATEFNDVAGVKFNLKSLSSKDVAKYAIDKMFKKKCIIIPGFFIKSLVVFSKLIPERLLIKITHSMQKRKI